MMHISDVLLALERGEITQSDLAALAGVSQSTVSKLARRVNADVKLSTANRLIAALVLRRESTKQARAQKRKGVRVK